MPENEKFSYSRFEGMTPIRKAMLILAEGAQAFGEGLTGKPFYSNYMERDSQQAKMAYDKWKAKRVAEANQSLYPTTSGSTAQPSMISGDMGSNSPFLQIGVPSVDEFGNIVQKPKVFPNPAFKAEEKSKAEVESSKRTSGYNLDLVAQNVFDLGDVLTKSWEEGGAGDIIKKGLTKAAQKGVVIGDPKTYKSSGALIGKRVELVSKMLPMLTQQIGKEGSVRLVESVFQKLGQTIPDEATPPELAKEQMRQSLLSMYRTRRALEQIDTAGLKDMSQTQLDTFAADIAKRTSQIEMTEEEQKAFDNFTYKALKPLNKYYSKHGMEHMYKDEYNMLRNQGLDMKEAKERLGI